MHVTIMKLQKLTLSGQCNGKADRESALQARYGNLNVLIDLTSRQGIDIFSFRAKDVLTYV